MIPAAQVLTLPFKSGEGRLRQRASVISRQSSAYSSFRCVRQNSSVISMILSYICSILAGTIFLLMYIDYQLINGRRSSPTPGISGERQFNVDESDAVARVRCMPLLGALLDISRPFFCCEVARPKMICRREPAVRGYNCLFKREHSEFL